MILLAQRGATSSRGSINEWYIERVPVDAKIGGAIDQWAEMVEDGWNLTVLLAPDNKTAIGLGWR